MNPKYDSTFVFDNDFPALQPDAPDPGELEVFKPAELKSLISGFFPLLLSSILHDTLTGCVIQCLCFPTLHTIVKCCFSPMLCCSDSLCLVLWDWTLPLWNIHFRD